MNNVLLWIGGLLVAVLCALFAVPHFVDWTRYRGVFEEEASRVLGRDLRVAGAVNLRLLPTPYVRFEKIRLSDAAGQTGEPFFRADDFTLWLAPGPLLRGAIEAREVELRRPTLKLRLNAEGGGNWQTLSIAKGSLPFVPSDVALQAVHITDGTISVDDADGRELVRSGGISGELSVSALEGPYRFKGNFDWAGARQEMKLATTALNAEGNLRLKVQTGVPGGGSGTLSFDGRLADISKQVKLEGQLTGQVAFDPAAIGRNAAVGISANAKPRRLPVEVRALLEANADGAKFTDVNLAFEHDDKPQLVAATAEVLWRGGLATRAAITSRWLDLDRLLGEQGGRPLDGMRRLSAAFGHLLPTSGSARVAIDVDQVTLGGEALSDLHADVEREGPALRLAGLRINLPGGTRASLSGLLPNPDALDGEVSLRGANFARFLAWIGYPATGDTRAEGIFSLKSRFAFDQQSVTLKDAIASLGNALLSGGIAYKWIDRPRLDMMLDGDQIDLGLFSPQALDLVALARQLGGFDEPGKAPPGAALKVKLDPKAQDTTLQIRAGRLVDAERDLRDVDLDASLIDGRVGVRRMRFTTAAGLEVEAEGTLADVGTQPRGEFRGTLAVADAASVGELVELFAQPSEGELFKRLRSLAPARVAWVTKLSGQKTGATPVVELSLDGQVVGRRLTANGRFDGRISDWRQGQVALSAAIDRPDWLRLRQILDGDGTLPAKTAVATGSGKSRLQFKTSGRPVDQLATYIKLEDDAFDAGWSGHVTFGQEALKSVDGELQIRAADLAQALTILGLAPRNLPGIAIEGAADVAFKDDIYRITPSALEVAGSVVGGEMTVSPAKEPGRRRIDGKLVVSRLSIPRLLDLLVDGKSQAGTGGTFATEMWQSAGFDFSLFDRVDGSLRIEAAEMALAADLGLQKGLIDAEISGGKLTIKTLDGDMLGARLSSRWAIEKAAAGAMMSGSGRIDGVNLALLPRAQGRIDGTAAVSFSVAGRGLSPRGVVSAMTGKGELQLAKAWAAGLSTLVVRRLGEDTITGKREPTVEAVEKAVATMLADLSRDARIPIGDRTIAFAVGDGAVKLDPYRVDTPDGRATNRTTIDLSRLMVDSEWKIDAVAPKPVVVPGMPEPKATSIMLPPAAIAFVGPLSAIGKLEPVVSVDNLVRELAVRRMEHDVAELERLRRLDEERAKAEAERRKADEAARQAAAASAAAAAAIPPVEPAAASPPAPAGASSPAAPVVAPKAATPDEGGPPPVAAGTDPVQTPPVAADVAPPTATKRTVGSEQRQVPSSQELKKARIQDVFKRHESGGN